MFSELMIVLLVMSIWAIVLEIQPVEAQGTIYIRADGSIYPPTPRMHREGDLYICDYDVYDSIEIQRNNMTLNGTGHTVQGTGASGSYGIYLSSRTNVTIINTRITAFYCGIELDSYSNNNSINGNTITANDADGIGLAYSSNNSISGNNVTNNNFGIGLGYSSNNSISENNITANNNSGIWLGSSYNNSISGNNITLNANDGIDFDSSSNNSINGNNITASNQNGIWLYFSSNNSISENNITANNNSGIWLGSSYNNSISGNNITLNANDGIGLDSSSNNSISGNNVELNHYGGIALYSSSNNSIDENHIVNNNNCGIELGFSSNNNSLNGNTITLHSYVGISLDSSSNNSISGNNIMANNVGILFLSSSNNSISGNLITAQDEYGIELHSSSDNRFIHNNFFRNTVQVDVHSSTNVWDEGYPSGGNYWSDYVGSDLLNGPYRNVTGSDGVGDAPWVLGSDNTDNYPFMNIDGWQDRPIAIESNVTISDRIADGVYLNFTVSGPSGQSGYVNVTVPVGLIQTGIRVFLDDVEVIPPPFPVITSNGTHYFIYFEFALSTHNVRIQYGTVDTAVASVTLAKTIVGQGCSLTINVTLVNEGDSDETLTATVYANTTEIETRPAAITSRNSTIITFTWNTTGFAYGNYTISAYAWPINGETDLSDNNLTGGWVFVAGVGDLTGGTLKPLDFVLNGRVQIDDVAVVARFFMQKAPPAPANCDVSGPTVGLPDGRIDISDVALVARHFGQHYTYP